jgi:hypothetical protein
MRTRALGIGMFLGMLLCFAVINTEPTGAATCVQDCDSAFAGADGACQPRCNGDQDCLDVCFNEFQQAYQACMQHAMWCTGEEYYCDRPAQTCEVSCSYMPAYGWTCGAPFCHC